MTTTSPTPATQVNSPQHPVDLPSQAPAGLRPQKAKSQLPVLNLIYVPKRIFVPPKPSVGTVRSFKSTPLSEVRLEDVLANRHLSPLSLKDFEGHLVFREHSAENLYFLLWINQYTKMYNAYTSRNAFPASQNPEVNPASQLPKDLSALLERGLASFFAPKATLELNLSSSTRTKTLSDAGISGNPADFEEAKVIVEHSLRHSLASHCKAQIANAGSVRLVFCFCLGFTVFALGLVPFFVAIFGAHARAWRAIGLPFLAFGAAVMAMAIQKICGVIWLLGEDRQMQSWELCYPPVVSASLTSLGCPSTPRSTSFYDEEAAYDEKEDSISSEGLSDPYPWETQDAPPSYDSALSRPVSYTSAGRRPSVPASPYVPASYPTLKETLILNLTFNLQSNVWTGHEDVLAKRRSCSVVDCCQITDDRLPHYVSQKSDLFRKHATDCIVFDFTSRVVLGAVLMAVPNEA
ncbi:hypothetical protein P7C70_g6854, partial [Phenoliferia sp. Uapishka_3]